MYDLIIIGGGPAGIAAGVYAARKRLNTLFITKDWGGQSIESVDIQNWIGTPSIAGDKLAKDLHAHLNAYADDIITIKDNSMVTKLEPHADQTWQVTTADDAAYQTKAVLIASGSSRRKLPVTGADVFENKGVTYCASCDGPLFSGQDVAVIGGGNAAFETAAQLLAYAKSVTLLNRSDAFRADPVTVEKVLAHPNMHALTEATPTEITGDKFVTGLSYTDKDGQVENLPAAGIFVEIGMLPNTGFVSDGIERDEYGRIKIDPWTQKTSAPGVWAAGDCTNIKYHQNNISAGDGVRALEDIYICLKTR